MSADVLPHTLYWPEETTAPSVGVVMGSQSDWPTLWHTHQVLKELAIPHECLIVSAHRTPERLRQYAQQAQPRSLTAVIAGAGGAAHLPGMLAAWTTVPVLGVPIQSRQLNGLDSLLSIVQMPGGVPVGTLAIGKAGAINAGLLAAAIVATHTPAVAERLQAYRDALASAAVASPLSAEAPDSRSDDRKHQ